MFKKRTEVSNKFTLKDARDYIVKIKQLDGMSKYTIKSYCRTFNDLKKFLGTDDIDINEISVNTIRNYIHWQLNEKTPYLESSRRDLVNQKGVSVATANNYIVLCKSIFNTLEQEEVIQENVFDKIKLIKQEEKKIETLTINEINKLFKTYDKRSYVEFRNLVICHIMLDAFSRVSETLSITTNDIDLENGAITFTHTKGKKVRTVPISIKTFKLLKELIKENEEFNSKYVFLTIFGEQLDADTFRKNLYEIAEKAGVQKNVYPHIFRHTASKMFIQDGGNIRILQLILGHASVTTTERYAHVLDSTIASYHNHYSPILKLQKQSKTRTNRKRR